ncbi:helix-turn-helix domain-containing protein [Macrococcus capreoli]|uniref:helix-turn-helix domain-containing protein n=1 Tax=Macrococcus capreoli TaxID=2982690 RepID=UPI003EE5434E
MTKFWGLYRARVERKESHTDLSKLLHIHKDTYGRKERGETDFTVSEALILSAHFKKSLDALFSIENRKEEK